MNRLRAGTPVERTAITLTALAAFYAIWLGIGLPGLGAIPADGGQTTGGSVLVSQIGAQARTPRRRVQRPAAVVPTIRRSVGSASARGLVAAAPPTPVVATPAPTQPGIQPAAPPPQTVAAPAPPSAPDATAAAETQRPTTPALTPSDVVQSLAATAQSTGGDAVDAVPLPSAPDVPNVGSLAPTLSPPGK